MAGLARIAGVDLDLFLDFQEGTAVLPSSAFDRLGSHLGLTLTTTSP